MITTTNVCRIFPFFRIQLSKRSANISQSYIFFGQTVNNATRSTIHHPYIHLLTFSFHLNSQCDFIEHIIGFFFHPTKSACNVFATCIHAMICVVVSYSFIPFNGCISSITNNEIYPVLSLVVEHFQISIHPCFILNPLSGRFS